MESKIKLKEAKPAVASRIDPTSDLERPRIGIYDHSTDVLGFKVRWGLSMRKAGIPVG